MSEPTFRRRVGGTPAFLRRWWLARVRIMAVLLPWVLSPGLHAYDEASDAPERRDLTRTVVSATSEVFFPYQYRDRAGTLRGFAVDIADAVARATNLPMERIAVANTAMAEALRSGRADVIQFWSETPERREWADFSVPIVEFETVVVVRRGDVRLRRLSDLDGRRVAVGQRGTVGHRYLATAHPSATPIFTETSEQFLRMLSAGEIDAAVMSRLTAFSMAEHFGLKNLQVLPDRIPGDAFDVRYCFAVRKGDSRLLARLNEGLAIIHRTGEFDEIYRRWFGRYESRTFTALQVVSYVALALALTAAAATWGLVRQRTLSRRVKQQAAEIFAQRSLLAALFDNHPLATVMLEETREGTVRMLGANPEATRLFRLAPDLRIPADLAALHLPGEIQVLFQDAMKRWRNTGETNSWELKLSESQRLLEISVVSLGTDEKGQHQVCVLSHDVTQRRLVDNELAQSRRLRALGELVGGIAHEFNNLLTPIIVTTSQARTGPALSPDLAADFTIIDHAARRAADLTRRLLAFGRKSDERPKLTSLAETAENCFALLRSTVDRRVEWTIHSPQQLPPLYLNPTDLNQIVFNLVINARDTLLDKLAQPHDQQWHPRLTVTVEMMPATYVRPARPPGRAVALPLDTPEPELERPVSWQRLTVEDNGLGIAPEIVERIFEPFFTTKPIGQGTGLGLATVWHLVTEMGGEATVESRLGEGSRFHVTFPQWGTTDNSGAPRLKAGRTRTSAHGLRILLAEDDPLVTRAAMAVLERVGYVVTHCIDGSEAWTRLERDSDRYQVLLLDLNMPRLNGVDLIRLVRRSQFAGAIAVMSGRISDEEKQALTELQVDRIINKPFNAGDLVEALQSLPVAKR